MHSQVLVLVSALAAGAVAQQDAPVTTNNPITTVYRASLPQDRFFADADLDGNVQGGITAQALANGTGVYFQVSLSNFPTDGGPFLYHIHAKAAVDGNCTSTMGHLDPYSVGEDHVCDPSAPAECQVGDLSGKHGTISTDPFTASYWDPYASTDPASPAFLGDKSFVVHYANKTRITCANFAGSVVPSLAATNSSNANLLAVNGSSLLASNGSSLAANGASLAATNGSSLAADGSSLAANGSLVAVPSGGANAVASGAANGAASGAAPGSTGGPTSGAGTMMLTWATLVAGLVGSLACLAL